jgi:hypothetical protein
MGEIEVQDINKLAIDRHILKGCDTCKHESYGDLYAMCNDKV